MTFGPRAAEGAVLGKLLEAVIVGLTGGFFWLAATMAYVASVTAVSNAVRRPLQPGNEAYFMGACVLFVFMWWVGWLNVE